MTVSTVNDERRTEVRWVDEYGARLVYVVGTYSGEHGWETPTSVTSVRPDRAEALHPQHLHITDPAVHDEIARAHAHAAATLRGDLATLRGGEVVESLVETPEGDALADALDAAREQTA